MKKITKIKFKFKLKLKLIFLKLIKYCLEKLDIYLIPDLNKELSQNIIYSNLTKSIMYKYDKKKINTLRVETTDISTDLCLLGKKYSTDKSPYNVSGHRHPYTSIYDLLFFNFRYEKINFAEIGILNNSSIKMFRKYFTKANIYGLEFNESLIKKAKKDKLQKVYYKKIDVRNKNNIYQTFRSTNKKFKVIIDDSTHEFNDQINVIEKTINFLLPGGILIIEDIFRYMKDKKKLTSTVPIHQQDNLKSIYLEKNYIKAISKYKKYFEKVFFIECNHLNKSSPNWDNDKLLVLQKK